jgi:hypothetical protein
MNEPSYFILVFGDPNQNGDTVESGQYAAGEGYTPFAVESGDMLLIYCTDGYDAYRRQFPGIGAAIRASARLIEYRWIPFATPLPRELIDQSFDPEDQRKMGELRFKQRRAFTISSQSFWRTVANQPIASRI